jgi:hypothetical protein
MRASLKVFLISPYTIIWSFETCSHTLGRAIISSDALLANIDFSYSPSDVMVANVITEPLPLKLYVFLASVVENKMNFIVFYLHSK